VAHAFDVFGYDIVFTHHGLLLGDGIAVLAARRAPLTAKPHVGLSAAGMLVFLIIAVEGIVVRLEIASVAHLRAVAAMMSFVEAHANVFIDLHCLALAGG